MNQILIIRNLNALMKGEKTIINMTSDGFVTPDWMPDKGMWCCYSCGYINAIESECCGKCNDEKFVLTEAVQEMLFIQELARRIEAPKAYINFPYGEHTMNGKRVVNLRTGQKYRSATAAAKALGIKKAKLYRILADENNQTNLRYQ